jgi:hypothetical protein
MIGELTSSKGWMLYPDGQWESGNNKIPRVIDRQYLPLMANFEGNGLGQDNFKKYVLGKMDFIDTSYDVLIKTYKDGAYAYPNIKEDWGTIGNAIYYVFNPKYLPDLSQIKSDTLLMIKIPMEAGDVIYSSQMKNVINEIGTRQLNTQYGSRRDYLTICAHIYPAKNIVQYLIYGLSYDDYDNVSTLGLIQIDYDSSKQLTTTDFLQKLYYETSWTNFKKLFGV